MKNSLLYLLIPLFVGCSWQRYYLEEANVSVILPTAPKKQKSTAKVYTATENHINYTVLVLGASKCMSFDCNNYNDTLESSFIELIYEIAQGKDNSLIKIEEIATNSYLGKEISFFTHYTEDCIYIRERMILKDKKMYYFILDRKGKEVIPDSIATTFFNSIQFGNVP